MNLLLPVNKLKEGMVLDEDIFDDSGKLLISKNSMISKVFLDALILSSYKNNIQVKVAENFIDIKPVVETAGGEKHEISSEHVDVEYSQKRIEIKVKFQEMHDNIKKSFDELSRNNTSTEVRNELEKTVDEIKNNLSVNIDLLNEILDIKAVDEYLFNHSLNVAVIANLIGKWLGLGQKELDTLILSGLVHDIGKLRVNQSVLNKAGKLTDEEFLEMKKHPAYSHQMLVALGYKDNIMLKAVTLHHEKEDGSGYPIGITGNKIPLYAKIIAVADIFDAMTSNRVYKERVSPFKVLEMFQNQTFGKLDYGIVMTFIKNFLEYYVGSEVLLSNNQKAKLVSLNIFEITKPLLITFDGEFIDISKNRNVKILDFSDKIIH